MLLKQKQTQPEWWLVGMDGEKESKKSVLSARLNDDDDS